MTPSRASPTLGLRLTAWYTAIFLVSVTAVGLLAYQLLAGSLESRDHDLLLVKLAEYGARYESGGVMAVSNAVAAERAAGGPDVVLVRLVGADADVRLASVPPAWQSFDLSALNDVPSAGQDRWQSVTSTGREATLEVVSRRLPDGVWVQVGRTTFGRERFLSVVRNLLGVMVLAVLAAGLAGGAALNRSALRPLERLRDTVGRIARTGQLGERVPAPDSRDLVADLSRVFNTMLARIETLVEGMRGALDNVAHDLRTPVARLRARAEATLASGADAAAYREALADCVEEADRVMSLLTSLMDISEAETGTMRLAPVPVRVHDLVLDTIDLYEDTAEDRGITLTASVPPDLAIRADRERLRQVLANLVDNALKYTGAGGTVTLGAERDNGSISIRVADTGAGIAAEDLPRIWDRLYRGQSGQREPGLGLGLSLVRAIVAAHQGTVTVTSEPGRGSTFCVTLPAAESPAPHARSGRTAG
jgi:signal transduction histidine kinase